MYRLGVLLIVLVIVLQVVIFRKEYDGTEYADKGVKMTEDTYLYTYDELTVWIEGENNLHNLILYKNGEPAARGLTVPCTIAVRKNDLVEISADVLSEEGAVPVEVHLSLKSNAFNENFYVSVFDFSGGSTIIGRFID